MSASLWCLVSLGLGYAPVPEAKGQGVIVLLAETTAYRAAKPAELIYEGVLQRNPGSGKIGVRFNPFRLAARDGAGKALLYDMLVPDQAQLLAGQVGQRVRIVGKLFSTEIDGKTVQELWPARLEPISANLTDTPGADGVYARVYWQPAAAQRLGSRHYVFRDGEQLAQALLLKGASTEQTAAVLLAHKLRVPEIDWKKHMLVCIAAGLRGAEAERLIITGVDVKDDTLTIRYRLQPTAAKAGTGGFGYPAETVLINRFNGPVRIVEETAVKPMPIKP